MKPYTATCIVHQFIDAKVAGDSRNMILSSYMTTSTYMTIQHPSMVRRVCIRTNIPDCHLVHLDYTAAEYDIIRSCIKSKTGAFLFLFISKFQAS